MSEEWEVAGEQSICAKDEDSMTRKSLPAASLALLLVLLAGKLISQQKLLSEMRSNPRTTGGKSVPADTVLVDGKIITVDAQDSIAEAIAIRNGKIVAVGSTSDVRSLISDATTVIDLHGRTATPGLIDSHGHFADGGVNELYHVDFSDVARIDDVLRKVRERVSQLKPGEWLLGDGWDEGKLDEHRYLYAADLDTLTPNNPVWLAHTTGHYGVANSYAMKFAHITADTQPPPAGTIDRNAEGVPTGVLKESAMAMVTELIPPTTPQQEHEGILHVIEELHREGITAVKDADIQSHTWDSYRRVLEEGKLNERVFVLWHAGTTLDSARQALAHISSQPKPPQSLGDGTLLSGGAKLYMDGSGGARTAWVYKDWNKNSTQVDVGNHGYPALDPETYRQIVRMFHQAGVHVGTHAVGDRAIDWVVDTYAQVLSEKPTVGLRHSSFTPISPLIMPSGKWRAWSGNTTRLTRNPRLLSCGGSATRTPGLSVRSALPDSTLSRLIRRKEFIGAVDRIIM